MPLPQQHSRVSLTDLKSQIGKKIGPERAQRYFVCLKKFLSQKLTKAEFDKQCFSTLGRENIPLHNQLVQSIIRNASLCKSPPPRVHSKDVPRPIRAGAGGKNLPLANERLRPAAPVPSTVGVWINGDALPQSPRKARSGIRDRRLKDRPSPLGPNGRTEAIANQPVVPSDHTVVRENGSLVCCDLRRQEQQHQIGGAEKPLARQQIEKSLHHDIVSVHREGSNVSEDGGIVMQTVDAISFRTDVQAPLGIPFCPGSVGAACRPQPLASNAGNISFNSNSYTGELCQTEVLKQRMDQIAEAQGLGGVTMDCANVLNNGLNVYLKRLIRSCVDLLGARSGHELTRQLVFKQLPQGKIINGARARNHLHVQSGSSRSSEGSQDSRRHSSISLLDFRVSMEQNPQQLGEDWPLLLEKICHGSWEQ